MLHTCYLSPSTRSSFLSQPLSRLTRTSLSSLGDPVALAPRSQRTNGTKFGRRPRADRACKLLAVDKEKQRTRAFFRNRRCCCTRFRPRPSAVSAQQGFSVEEVELLVPLVVAAVKMAGVRSPAPVPLHCCRKRGEEKRTGNTGATRWSRKAETLSSRPYFSPRSLNRRVCASFPRSRREQNLASRSVGVM